METNIIYNGKTVSQGDINRFWQKVYKTDNCWNWNSTLRDGYGLFSFSGRPVGAHRFSYAIANGLILQGQFVLHGCDNPQCVNPGHLRLGDHKANSRDRSERDRTHSDFTSEQVRVARSLAASGKNLYQISEEISAKSTKNLLLAIRGSTFPHVDVPPVPNVDISRERKVRLLSDNDILEIQESLKKPYRGIVKKLAERYNVSHTAISLIRSNRYKKK